LGLELGYKYLKDFNVQFDEKKKNSTTIQKIVKTVMRAHVTNLLI